jgi:hypothetical protein
MNGDKSSNESVLSQKNLNLSGLLNKYLCYITHAHLILEPYKKGEVVEFYRWTAWTFHSLKTLHI